MRKKAHDNRKKILRFALAGALAGFTYGNIEFLIDSLTDDVEPYIPLMIRGITVGTLVGSIAIAVELQLRERFRKRPFLFLVIVRALMYTLIISLSLFIVNGVWFAVNNNGASVGEEFYFYFSNRMYLINLLTIFLVLLIIGSIDQINTLHRRGELWNFILGRYHKPGREERIFCFIDLKGSTSLTERLGDIEYANFLRDYYSDISDALRATNAQIYQYVGDEIVLSWSLADGIRDQNCLRCVFLMQEILVARKDSYLMRYDAFPEFRAGIHCGPCVVTWVGELKREIVYIGDVLNTTARIQELCKRYELDFLVSEALLSRLNEEILTELEFVDEIVPRGKVESIKIFGSAHSE